MASTVARYIKIPTKKCSIWNIHSNIYEQTGMVVSAE